MSDAANWKRVCILRSKVQQLPFYSVLEVCFQSCSLLWNSVIMLYFTLCSVLKICILRTTSIFTEEERHMLGVPWWRFLGRAEVPHCPPQGRLTGYYGMRSLHQTQILSLLPLRTVSSVMDTLPVPFLKLQTKRNHNIS